MPAPKLKAHKLGTEPYANESYEVASRRTLNCTKIDSNNNKYYSAEIWQLKNGKTKLFTEYGRVGAQNPAREIRMCDSQYHAEQVLEGLIKSKTKKGYVEVKLLKADVGSDKGKQKVEAAILSEKDAKKAGFKIEEETKSILHPAIQSVVRSWFGSIDKFVVDTLDTSKCALGQLSINQINKGRDLLLDARKLVAAGAKDISELNNITSKFYSNIPMNFGYKRLDADVLRFDNNDKLDKTFDMLDTLENAKAAEKVLKKKNAIDEQYKSLKTEMRWIDPKEDAYKWLDLLFHKTRAKNHGFLGKIKIINIFALTRLKEYEDYINMIQNMAKENQKGSELPALLKPIWDKRIEDNKEYEKLRKQSNILTLFHGTRTPNFPKILSTKIIMRKPGFTVAGSMYDKNGGLYFGFSSKAANYTSASGGFWSGGSDNKGYLFVSDVALGKQQVARGAYPYTLQGIKPCMSVWAKGGYSGVINDEFIVYTEKQNWLRYIVEFETKTR